MVWAEWQLWLMQNKSHFPLHVNYSIFLVAGSKSIQHITQSIKTETFVSSNINFICIFHYWCRLSMRSNNFTEVTEMKGTDTVKCINSASAALQLAYQLEFRVVLISLSIVCFSCLRPKRKEYYTVNSFWWCQGLFSHPHWYLFSWLG